MGSRDLPDRALHLLEHFRWHGAACLEPARTAPETHTAAIVSLLPPVAEQQLTFRIPFGDRPEDLGRLHKSWCVTGNTTRLRAWEFAELVDPNLQSLLRLFVDTQQELTVRSLPYVDPVVRLSVEGFPQHLFSHPA
mgnify:CR=1 FL=1